MLDHAAIRVRDAQGAILRGRCRGRNVDKTRDFIAAYNRRDRVATRLRYYGRGKRSGVEIEEELYHQVTTFEAGWIVRIRYFTDWSEALDAVRSE
jgi:hypothetical protein